MQTDEFYCNSQIITMCMQLCPQPQDISACKFNTLLLNKQTKAAQCFQLALTVTAKHCIRYSLSRVTEFL